MATPEQVQGPQAAPEPHLGRALLKRTGQILAQLLLLAAILFLAAGRLDWGRAWLCLGLQVAGLLVDMAVLLRLNPGVIAVRAEHRAGTEAADRPVVLAATLAYLAVPALAGLDAARFQWAALGWGWAVAGLALHFAGQVPILAALATNPFLERGLRVQADRAQHVVTGGPYLIVRHPLYAGMILQALGLPLLLGSGWALVPAAAFVLLLALRTGIEDRMLRRSLAGYAEYAQRTRARLLPGLW